MKPASTYNPRILTGKDKNAFPLTTENGMVDLKSVCEVLRDYNYEGFVASETREQYPENKDAESHFFFVYRENFAIN